MLLVLFLLYNKNQAKFEKNFLNSVYQNIYSTYDIKVNKIIKYNSPLLHPAGTWINIATFKTLNQHFRKNRDYCLNFRIPFKEKLGVLVFVAKKSSTCNDYFYKKNKIKMTKIKELSLNLAAKTFNISITTTTNKLKSSIPLINIKTPTQFKRYATATTQYFYPGLSVGMTRSRPITLHTKTKSKEINNGEICHPVDNKCKKKSKNNCHLCSGASYMVINNACSGSYIKYCGIDDCGKKNKSACLKGTPVAKKNAKSIVDHCLQAEKIAFCAPSLVPQCDASKRIICL